jgi:hypothetical protein
MKLIAPIKLLVPARWREKIAYSTAGPGLYRLVDKGGYIVQPVPTPGPPIVKVDSSRVKLKGNNQKLILFILGNAISGAFIISGTNQLPNPPIKAGMTMKNIITIACIVTTQL